MQVCSCICRPDLDAQAFVPDFTATPHKSSFSGALAKTGNMMARQDFSLQQGLNITEEISNAPLLGKSELGLNPLAVLCPSCSAYRSMAGRGIKRF